MDRYPSFIFIIIEYFSDGKVGDILCSGDFIEKVVDAFDFAFFIGYGFAFVDFLLCVGPEFILLRIIVGGHYRER